MADILNLFKHKMFLLLSMHKRNLSSMASNNKIDFQINKIVCNKKADNRSRCFTCNSMFRACKNTSRYPRETDN